MPYIQLNEDGSFQRELSTGVNFVWDDNNYCTPEHLVKDGKAEQFNVAQADEVPQPFFDPMTQSVAYDGYEQVNGKWRQKWVVSDLSAEQKAEYTTRKAEEKATAIRAERDAKLAESDWMVIKSIETGVALATEWATYRQALRDVTNQAGFPNEVTWPVKPA